MNRLAPLSIAALVLFAAPMCQADTLVITYRSGKTQTIMLDEPSQSINSWQFVAGSALQQQSIKQDELSEPVKQVPVQEAPATQQRVDVKAPDKTPANKSGVRVRWNAKPISD